MHLVHLEILTILTKLMGFHSDKNNGVISALIRLLKANLAK